METRAKQAANKRVDEKWNFRQELDKCVDDKLQTNSLRSIEITYTGYFESRAAKNCF